MLAGRPFKNAVRYVDSIFRDVFLFVGLSSRRFLMQTMRLVLRNTIANACACFVLCFAIAKRKCAFRIVFYDSKRMCFFFYFRKCHFFDSCDSKYCGKYFFCLQKEKHKNIKRKAWICLRPNFNLQLKTNKIKKITASPLLKAWKLERSKNLLAPKFQSRLYPLLEWLPLVE